MSLVVVESISVSEIAFIAFGIIMISGIFVILFFGLNYLKNSPKNSEDYKKCPFCAEDIKKAAIVCRYCKRDLVK